MTTILDKELKRQITVDGADYTIALDPEGIRLTGKGKRNPEVALRWQDILSGETALAVALNASLAQRPPAAPAAKAAGSGSKAKTGPASRAQPTARTAAAKRR